MAGNAVLVVILLAQFIIVVDSTFMNVSISTLVDDFNTSVTGIQNAITLYTLVMASFMIAGAKLGDIIGRKRAFTAGLIVYAIGTTITSVAPSLLVFMFGWSILEGLGAAIMLPAMMSLIVSNFAAGPERSRAYAAFAAIAGIAAGIGPIIGGLFTSYLSWRLAFLSELLVAAYILWKRHLIADAPYQGSKPRFDLGGLILSVLGLVTLVEGIVLASAYGFIHTRKDFVISGHTLLSTGQISPSIILVGAGLIILAAFAWHEVRRSTDTLLNINLFRTQAVSAGAVTQLMQNLILIGVIFAISLYVQMELEYSAIKSGITLLPLSLSVLASAALSGRVLSRRVVPRHAVIAGFVTIILGVVAMGLLATDATSGSRFFIGLVFIGFGVGVVGSQNQNLVMSSVDPNMSNETSGILNTALNLGSSFGTSIAGAMILTVFVNTATTLTNSSASLSPSQQSQVVGAVNSKAQVVSDTQLQSAISSYPPSIQQEVLSINSQARQQALTTVYSGLAVIGLLGIVAGLRLPTTKPLAAATEPIAAPSATTTPARRKPRAM